VDRLRRQARSLRNAPTDAERVLWQVLRGHQLQRCKFRRQFPIAGYIADFACVEARLVIEVDGGQHAEQVTYDDARTRVLAAAGYRVLRFWNNDVLTRTEDVVAEIFRQLPTPPQPSPSLAAKGREPSVAAMAQRVARNHAVAPAPSLSLQAKGRVGEGCLPATGSPTVERVDAGARAGELGRDKQ